MKFRLALSALVFALAGPVYADDWTGDADLGATVFNTQCQTCHYVQTEDGTLLAGRVSPIGPNLFGSAGGVAGSSDFARYSTLIQAANTAGLVWDETNLVAFLDSPTGFLTEATGAAGRSGMPMGARTEADALNVAAYLASLTGE